MLLNMLHGGREESLVVGRGELMQGFQRGDSSLCCGIRVYVGLCESFVFPLIIPRSFPSPFLFNFSATHTSPYLRPSCDFTSCFDTPPSAANVSFRRYFSVRRILFASFLFVHSIHISLQQNPLFYFARPSCQPPHSVYSLNAIHGLDE